MAIALSFLFFVGRSSGGLLFGKTGVVRRKECQPSILPGYKPPRKKLTGSKDQSDSRLGKVVKHGSCEKDEGEREERSVGGKNAIRTFIPLPNSESEAIPHVSHVMFLFLRSGQEAMT
jgi:hypothetical protein